MQNNKPIFTIGRYQLIHRNNDDYNRFEQHKNNTSLEFSLLRTFVAFRIVSACFYVVMLMATAFNVPVFFIIVGLVIWITILIFGSREFFALFKIIDTKNPNKSHLGLPNQLESLWLGTLVIISMAQTYLNYGNIDNALLNHTANGLLILLGIPYLIYQLKTLLFK